MYSLDVLRGIGQCAKSEANHHLFSLKYELRMKIIGMDIRKSARPYRKSRAGKKLCYKISSLVNRPRLYRPRNHMNSHRNYIKIIPTVNMQCNKTFDCRCAIVNCHSVVNKTSDFKVELIDHKLDICALTETWIREGDVTTAVQLCPEGYSAVSIPREGKTGGGIGVVYRSDIILKSKSVYNYQSTECADFLLSFQNMSINLCVIYRPPHTSIAAFCNDLTDYCERNITSPGKMVIVGDVNIHTNKELHPDAVLFHETLVGLGLRNHVDFATHHLRNSLDAVMSFQDDSIVNTVAQGKLFSDHHWVLFNISSSSSMHRVDEIAYRKIKFISADAFAGDISHELDRMNVDKLDLEPCLILYNSTLVKILDQHAPIKKKSVPNRKRVPWLTGAIREEIRKHRKMEHIWRHDRENLDRYQDFCSQCRLVSNLLFATEKEYYRSNLHKHRGNIKQVFKLCDSLLGWKKEQSFPFPGLTTKNWLIHLTGFSSLRYPT